MSRSRNEQLIEWMAKAAMFGDCAVLGVASVLFTSRLITFYLSDLSALTRIKSALEVRVSDLKTLISEDERVIDDMLVVVKGTVDAKCNLDDGMKISIPAVLVSQQTGDVGVVLEKSQMVCLTDFVDALTSWLASVTDAFVHAWTRYKSYGKGYDDLLLVRWL